MAFQRLSNRPQRDEYYTLLARLFVSFADKATRSQLNWCLQYEVASILFDKGITVTLAE